MCNGAKPTNDTQREIPADVKKFFSLLNSAIYRIPELDKRLSVIESINRWALNEMRCINKLMAKENRKKLSEDKIYYISNPPYPEVNEKGYWENNDSEQLNVNDLWDSYDKEKKLICFVRPQKIFPYTMLDEERLERSECLMSACDAIIMCGDWEHSSICLAEKEQAEGMCLEVLTLEEITGDINNGD